MDKEYWMEMIRVIIEGWVGGCGSIKEKVDNFLWVWLNKSKEKIVVVREVFLEEIFGLRYKFVQEFIRQRGERRLYLIDRVVLQKYRDLGEKKMFEYGWGDMGDKGVKWQSLVKKFRLFS